ncbi:MAG TPA: S49 family peptidase, partial [Sphingomicrobium sp.]|nr:S49 family peptidase [Sphingomicrobium sp.]
ALIQAGVESNYRTFLSIVAQSRHKTPQDIDRIAQGRVWDGGSARQIGLVDRFGGLDDAIAAAASAAKLGDERGVTLLEQGPSFTDQLLGMVAGEPRDEATQDALAYLSPAPDTLVADALARLQTLLGGATIQATCIDCPAVAPAAVTRPSAPSAWWMRVAAWASAG